MLGNSVWTDAGRRQMIINNKDVVIEAEALPDLRNSQHTCCAEFWL